jgi:hypothetical protein
MRVNPPEEDHGAVLAVLMAIAALLAVSLLIAQ